MRLEQQYRTGRFPKEEPVPTWLEERVHEVSHADWPLASATEQMHELLQDQAKAALAVAAAKQLLGIDETFTGSLLARTEACIAADPLREAEYWSAMWKVRNANRIRGDYQRNLAWYAGELEQAMLHREHGWPANWSRQLSALWQELGGSAFTARAWARAGWGAYDSLLAAVKTDAGWMSISERVRCTTPPQFVSTRTHEMNAEYDYDHTPLRIGNR